MNSNERSERRKKLNAKAEKILKVIEAEQSRTVATERKKATRRKILLGALVIELTNTGVLDRDLILNHLDSYLTKPHDRQLFGLSPSPSPSAGDGEAERAGVRVSQPEGLAPLPTR